MSELPQNWSAIEIEHVLQPLDNGKVIQQGWSPQCEKEPASLEEWGVLKTTAIQEGYFLPEENKKLPSALEARPAIEVKPGDILMTCAGPRNRCGVTSFVKEVRPRLMMSGKIYRFRADPRKIEPSYLEAFLLSQDAKSAIDRMKTGINDSGLNLTHSRFLKLIVPLAPIEEQKRIMAKIDELQSQLDNAIQCMTASEQKQKVFYQAVLDNAFLGCVEERKLSEVLARKLSNGYSGKPVRHVTNYKVLGLSATTSGIFLDEHYKFLDEENLEHRDIWCAPNDILIQRGNTIEYVGVPAIYTGEPNTFIFPDLMIRARANESIISTKFLYYALSSPKIRNYLRKNAKGSAGTMPKINQEILASTPIPFCSLEKQRAIVDTIEEQLSNGAAIERVIQDSLAKAHILRQSILKKAFSGQLVAQDAKDEPASVLLERIRAEKTGAKPAKASKKVAKKSPSRVATVIAFPNTIASITTTDLHAGIIGLAYSQHEQNPRMLNTFGHVKAEKISHLVEYHLGIPLGRAPVKDAAGPNDYRHLKKVEHRANMANWFSVQQRPGGEGYVFAKKRRFDGLITKTSQALGEKAAEVEALIRLLLPLNTQQAEIVATLYAAWNNLLIAGSVAPSDEEIVTEARENWHASKMDIEREKFFKTLEWLKRKQLTPKGMGTIVNARTGAA